MDVVTKQQWSDEETITLLALWSSTEVQSKLEGVSRKKPVFEAIQRDLAEAGYDRTIAQITNKLKKLKKDYRDHKKELTKNGSGRPRKRPHFDLMDSILGDRSACPATGAVFSVPSREPVMDDAVIAGALGEQSPVLDAEVDGEGTHLLPPRECSSPSPSASSCGSPEQSRRGKRTREYAEIIEYMERSDERHLQLTKDIMRRLETDSKTLLGYLERMVAVMEAQVNN